MSKICEIQSHLSEYMEKALEEYSELEEKRHKHFKHKTYSKVLDRLVEVDGGHPDAIGHWIETLKEIVFLNNANTRKKHFKDIFKRTNLDATYYRDLTSREKETYEALLLKTEASILQEDFLRAEERFNPQQPRYTQNQLTPQEENYYKKTALELFNEYMEIRKRETSSNLDKDEQGIKILLSATDKKYLIDFDNKDFDNFIDILGNLPPNVGKFKDIYEKYQDNFPKIAEYCKEKGCEKQTKSTGWSKFSKVRTFLDFAIEEDALKKNILQGRKYNKKFIENYFKDGAKGVPFNTTELNNFFNNSSWFNTLTSKKTIKQKPEYLYIPLLGLFCGMRLNEISGLRVGDIKQDEDTTIWYIDLVPHAHRRLKTKKSQRKIPLNRILLHQLGFLNFIKKIEDKDKLIWNLTKHKKNGYGHNVSKAFNNPKFKQEWISQERYNDDNIKLDFHSFRHTFITRLHIAGVEETIINFLTGHEQNTQSQQTYTQSSMKVLKKAIDKIDIQDIDFTTIKEAIKII